MKEKIKVGILFGGKSAEHEVSLQSAKNVYDALDSNKYEAILIGIDKSGRWLLGDEGRFLLDSDDPKKIRLNALSDPVALIPQSRGFLNTRKSIDVVFPILHGPFGEDGTVQGLLKLADIPFVGAGVLASAVSMDKDVMKRLLAGGGLPIGKYSVIRNKNDIPPFDKIKAELGLPLFIKPANMGSSVGVSKVNSNEEYLAALEDAFEYDTKIIVEEFIPGRELECSVLGSSFADSSSPHAIKASGVGEIIPSHDFYSYDAKYIDEQGAALVIPANIPPEIIARIQELSLKVFDVLCCDGLGRVDFFLKEDGSIIINEINTMPGFTRISMYPKLWEASGISYSALIDSLIEIAFLRYNAEKGLKTEK